MTSLIRILEMRLVGLCLVLAVAVIQVSQAESSKALEPSDYDSVINKLITKTLEEQTSPQKKEKKPQLFKALLLENLNKKSTDEKDVEDNQPKPEEMDEEYDNEQIIEEINKALENPEKKKKIEKSLRDLNLLPDTASKSINRFLPQGPAVLMKQGLKVVSTSVKTGMKKGLGKLRNFVKRKAAKLREKALETWEKFKKAVKNPKKTAKKMVKKVMEELYETGKEESLIFLQGMITDFIENEAKNRTSCECFGKSRLNKDQTEIIEVKNRCRCCFKPPGLKPACLKIIARKKKAMFDLILTWEGKEYLRTQLAPAPPPNPNRSHCSLEVENNLRNVCTPMPGPLHMLVTCIVPGHSDSYNNSQKPRKKDFGGCFVVTVDKLELFFEKCISFDSVKREILFLDSADIEAA